MTSQRYFFFFLIVQALTQNVKSPRVLNPNFLNGITFQVAGR